MYRNSGKFAFSASYSSSRYSDKESNSPVRRSASSINSKVRFVLFEQGSPQAGTWDKHFAHRMAHTVFHRVVLQLIDNSRPTVHNTQHHAIGVNRVARGLNHQRQIQLILLLRCFRQVIRINYRVVYHAGFHKRIAISLRNVLYGSITILLQKSSTPAFTGETKYARHGWPESPSRPHAPLYAQTN